MGRAPCCDKATVKRGPWSPEEDATLKSYIHQNGTGGNWITLPPKIGLKRCGKSCRLRWLNYLRPNLRHGGFSDQEDNIICSLYLSIGSRWSIIAAQLPGRTDNDIKNYWNTRLKKKLLGYKQKKEHQLSAMKEETIEHHHSIVSPIINWPQLPPLLPTTPIRNVDQEPIIGLQNPNDHISTGTYHNHDPNRIIGDHVMQYPQGQVGYNDNVIISDQTIMVQDMFDELLSNNYQMDQQIMTSQTGPDEWSIINGQDDYNGFAESSSQLGLEIMGPLDHPNLAHSTHHQQYYYSSSSCQDNRDLFFKDDHNYVYHQFNHV